MFPMEKILELLWEPSFRRTHSYDGNLPYYNFKIRTDRQTEGAAPKKKKRRKDLI
jgi:hypothetical protein